MGAYRLEKYAFANVAGGGWGGHDMIWPIWPSDHGLASEKWSRAASGNMEYWQVYWRDEVLLSTYLGLLSSNGNHNHPVVIWKSGAFIPLKGFLFCRFLVMLLPETLCQLMFACFWNGKRLLIASPTTWCSELAGALLAGHFPRHTT